MTMAVVAFTVAALNEWCKAHPWGVHSVWWYVPVAVVCALLSTAWRRWTDTWPPVASPAAVDADEWSRQLAALLRERYWLSDTRVRSIVAEAQAHAAEAGRSLHEEFGRPEEYAAGFVPDLARRSRLTLTFYLTVVALNLFGVLIGWSWQSLVVAAGFTWLAWREYQRYRRLRGDSG
jgi:hypothetical protein